MESIKSAHIPQELNNPLDKEQLDRAAEQVLQLAQRRAQQAEVYAVTSQETPVSFHANRLKQIKTAMSRSLTLRVIAEGRMGLASTTVLDAPQTLVDEALALTPWGSQVYFDLPASSPQDDVPSYDPALAALSRERLAEMGQSIVKGLLAHDPRIVSSVEINKYVAEVVILNTRGCHASFRKTFLLLNLQASFALEDERVLVWDGDASCRYPLDDARLVKRVIDQFQLARRPAQVSSGSMPVIFTPKGAAYTLLPPLQDAFNGERVLQGFSPLAGRLNDQVADTRLSLYDHGRVAYSPRAYPCDGEGVPTQCTTLLENGVVKNFYYDLHTAALADASSTGNGWRLPGQRPSPTPSVAIMAEGKTSYKKMLADIREGILVDQTLDASAGNREGGEFSAQVQLGYKIERGEIVGRVKDVIVSGNLFDALSNVMSIGDEAVWVAGSYQIPYLCFRSLAVAGAE